MWMLGISVINLITEIIILLSIQRISRTIKNIPDKNAGKKLWIMKRGNIMKNEKGIEECSVTVVTEEHQQSIVTQSKEQLHWLFEKK